MIKMEKNSRGTFPLFELVAISVLLLLCVLYYQRFASDLINFDEKHGYFQFALNKHDHFVYLVNIDVVRMERVIYDLSNDKGISFFYSIIWSLFPYDFDPDLTLISLIVNSFTICLCYFYYIKISDELKLGTFGKYSFFFNLSLIYFSQLINKDVITILAFLFAVHCGLKNRIFPLLLFMPFFGMIRIQLLAFILIYIFLLISKNHWFRIIIVYTITSLVAGYLSVFYSVIGEDSLGEGFSSYLVQFNQQYFVGYFLFNPVRTIQYFFDAYGSFWFFTPHGGVDTAKLLRLPQLLLLLFLIKPLLSLFSKFGYWLKTDVRPLVLVIVSYLLTWLMNPTVNARYVMLITPVLVLFALYARNHATRARVQAA